MKKFVLAVAALASMSAFAQTTETVVAGTTLTTTVVTVAVPLALVVGVTAAAEENDTPSAPQTSPSTTGTR